MVGMDDAVLITGMACLAFGVHRAIRARGRRSWEVVEAEIVDSQVANQGTKFVPDWEAHVHYRYSVGGVQYEKDWNSKMGAGRYGNFRRQAENEANRYPLGANVRVQVSPEDPAFSVLEAQGTRYIYGNIVVGVLFIAYGIYNLAA